jgi:hypothetical protein
MTATDVVAQAVHFDSTVMPIQYLLSSSDGMSRITVTMLSGESWAGSGVLYGLSSCIC